MRENCADRRDMEWESCSTAREECMKAAGHMTGGKEKATKYSPAATLMKAIM